MSVKLDKELKLNAEITFASSTTKEVLETPKYTSTCCGHEEKSVMFIGCIKQIKPEGLEKWLREVTPVAYGHLHFNSYQESSAFYNLMKDVVKDGPYGEIRFIASQYFSTKIQVVYMKNTFTSSEGRKRKLIEIENNENNRQPLNLPYDLYETEQEFIIVIDTPSVKNKGEISISVRKDHIINIKGNISRDTIPGKQLESQNPLPFGKFDVKVNLPTNIDSEESTDVIVEAGVTTIMIKKEVVMNLRIS
ncbi:6975_t:CDS:2 [Funneliformis caledonium]|uniref:6975_t:CDS:1 n=1 Tax=Funneliformis caledonium TaxID=1117310 RepID=A0A9N9DZU6_9GLOM|nr:6975_t:CDS:2 [Funneliformis caledonium]